MTINILFFIQTQIPIPSWFDFNEEVRDYWLKLGFQLGVFILVILVSLILGRTVLSFVNLLIKKLFPESVYTIYQNLTETVTKSLRVTLTLLLFYVALDFIRDYDGLYRYLKLGVDCNSRNSSWRDYIPINSNFWIDVSYSFY